MKQTTLKSLITVQLIKYKHLCYRSTPTFLHTHWNSLGSFFNDFDVGFDLMKEKKQVLYGIYGVGSMGSIKQNKIHIRLIEIAS